MTKYSITLKETKFSDCIVEAKNKRQAYLKCVEEKDKLVWGLSKFKATKIEEIK